MLNFIADQTATEVVARLYFVAHSKNKSGVATVKLELTNMVQAALVTVDQALLQSKPPLVDGDIYRCQLLNIRNAKNEVTDKWKMIGISTCENLKGIGLDMLPLSACVDQQLVDDFWLLDPAWKNPGLRDFVDRVFKDTVFALSWVLAPLNPHHESPTPSGLFAEAVAAAHQIQENPFLTDFQKELGIAAVLLSRPGCEWVRANQQDEESASWTINRCPRFNPRVMRRLQLWFPDIYTKLISIWTCLENPLTSDLHQGPKGALHVAIYLALRYAPVHNRELNVL